MKKIIIISLLLILGYSADAQTAQNIVAKSLTGSPVFPWAPYPDDSSVLFINRVTGKVFRTKLTGGTSNSYLNGLTLSGGVVKLGGSLTDAATVVSRINALSTNSLSFSLQSVAGKKSGVDFYTVYSALYSQQSAAASYAMILVKDTAGNYMIPGTTPPTFRGKLSMMINRLASNYYVFAGIDSNKFRVKADTVTMEGLANSAGAYEMRIDESGNVSKTDTLPVKNIWLKVGKRNGYDSLAQAKGDTLFSSKSIKITYDDPIVITSPDGDTDSSLHRHFKIRQSFLDSVRGGLIGGAGSANAYDSAGTDPDSAAIRLYRPNRTYDLLPVYYNDKLIKKVSFIGTVDAAGRDMNSGAIIRNDTLFLQYFDGESPGLVPPGGSSTAALYGDGWHSTSWRMFINQIVTATDANITATPGAAYRLPVGTLTANRTISLANLTTAGDYIEIYNDETAFTWSFTGGSVYLADGSTLTTLAAQTRYMLRFDGSKILIIN